MSVVHPICDLRERDLKNALRDARRLPEFILKYPSRFDDPTIALAIGVKEAIDRELADKK